MGAVLLITTAGSEKEANKIASRIVAERLAACVNVIPGITSHYYWEGKLCEEKEAMIFIKTVKGKVKKLINEIKKIHSYTIPEIIFLEIEGGEKRYLKWLKEITKSEN